MPHSGTPWSDAETERLAEMYFAAVAARAAWTPAFRGQRQPLLGIDAIAAVLGRSVSAVNGQITRTGMSAPGAKLRACIPCRGKMFFSSGVGNRDLPRLLAERTPEVRVMTEPRKEHRHWNLLRRVFGFHDCRDAGAAKAAEVLGVERELLRVHFDVNLTAASRNALAVQLLAHADAKVAAAEKALAEAVALRHDVWVAEQVSGREMCAVDYVTFTNSAGELQTFDMLPHEVWLKDLLEEVYV